MHVDGPSGVKVYIDGDYVGVAPVSFEKPEPGPHTITLSMEGFITKSYTENVADDDNDLTVSFPELMPESEE